MAGPPRLEPFQMMLMKLDEIAKRLEDLGAVGILRSKEETVGDEWTELLPGAWKSADIWNDGGTSPDEVYLRVGQPLDVPPWEQSEAYLKKNDHLKMDLDTRRWDDSTTYPSIWARCETNGSATVRIFKLA